MQTGVVKFFNKEKGFGFITDDETSSDIFFHKTGIKGSVRDGDQVQFDTEDGKKGPIAVNVKRC